MRLSLFRRNTFEGLVIARSNGGARKRSSNMMAWNKLARRNGTEPEEGLDAGSEGSSSGQEASAPADTGSEEPPIASAQSNLDPAEAVS
jgi:hypothetical protein